MAMTEAVLNVWLKNPGDSVAEGEVLAEIETDKSVLDLESPSDGLLGRHLVSAGATVPVGHAIVRILAPGEVEPDDNTGLPAEDASAVDDAAVGAVTVDDAAVDHGAPAVDDAAAPAVSDQAVTTEPGGRAPHRLSPRQRQQLREQAAAEAKAASEAKATSDRPGQRFRAAIAEHVSESWRTIPHFAVVRHIDARGAREALAIMRASGLPATTTDLLLHALSLALTTCAEDTGDLGLAVATPDGVVIPVIAGVSGLGPAALVAARAAAVARARSGQMSSRDLALTPLGSLSNLGGLGVDSFTGIIPVGQKLLLTTGTIVDRPVAVDGQVTVRPSVAATLNVDHRHFDGDTAAGILESFQSALDQSITWAGHKEKLDV
jgi:pyruvate dehydrogenase E2 component (dihydrolipoamide acetyltransferase)